MNKTELLRLDLQTFADNNGGIDNKKSSDGTQNTDESKKDVDNRIDNRIPYERFKEKVDEANALKEKLAKIEKAQEDAKRKELEEQNEYKQLYEQALEKAEQARQESLSIKKSALLTQAGYGAEQTKLLAKLVEGETDEELAESIKLLKATIPVKDEYGDPSAFNGEKKKPDTVGADEIGAKMFERIKGKIF